MKIISLRGSHFSAKHTHISTPCCLPSHMCGPRCCAHLRGKSSLLRYRGTTTHHFSCSSPSYATLPVSVGNTPASFDSTQKCRNPSISAVDGKHMTMLCKSLIACPVLVITMRNVRPISPPYLTLSTRWKVFGEVFKHIAWPMNRSLFGRSNVFHGVSDNWLIHSDQHAL